MAWWGTLAGGAIGFILGGPLGALMGGLIGGQFSGGFSSGTKASSLDRTQAAFFVATFSVMGHIAKADGQVSKSEIEAVNHLMDMMRLGPDQRQAAVALFNQGKQPGFDLDGTLLQFRQECHGRTTLLRQFLEIQVMAALADGRVDVSEQYILKRVAEILGFSWTEVQHLLNMNAGGGATRGPRGTVDSLADAYRILGVSKTDSDANVKRAYRRLINQHHPDKLIARGMPEEMVEVASTKTKEIRDAWERIRTQRGVR